MADKQRYIGPDGAMFVPNVDDDAIAIKAKAGEWREATAAEVKAFLSGKKAPPAEKAPEPTPEPSTA